jgi:hypothetical protein
MNERDAKFCVNCGTHVYSVDRWETRGDTCFGRPEQRRGEECFGLPFGGSIVGLIFGVFLIFIGLSIAFGLHPERWIGPFMLILVGILILVGVVYSRLRYKS